MNKFEIRQYTDEEGKLVTARVPIDPISLEMSKEVPVRFSGTYSIPHPEIGAMRCEVEFPEGWTLEMCFANFKEKVKEHYKSLMEEAKKERSGPKLWTPGESTGNKSGLFVPN